MAKTHVLDVDPTADGVVADLGPSEVAQAVREVCQICKRSFKVPYIYQHRRKDHGIYGGRSGRLRKQTEQTAKKAAKLKPRTSVEKVDQSLTPEVVSATRVNHEQPSFKVMPFIVLEDHEGSMWIAERIR